MATNDFADCIDFDNISCANYCDSHFKADLLECLFLLKHYKIAGIMRSVEAP